MGNEFVITNRNGTAYLNIFAPNDLPKRAKNGFSIKDIISFSKKDYYVFNSYDEANEFWRVMLRACDVDILNFLNNSSRAGKVLHAYPCGTWAEAQRLAEEWNTKR